MKRKNLQIISILTFVLFVISVQHSYSQWTLASTISVGGSGFPSISVVDQNVAWVVGGTNTPAIIRTTNGGTTWTTIPTTGITLDLFCVWAKDVNTCFVGDGGAAGGAGGNARLYKTTDAGANWTVVASTGGNAGFFNGIVFSRTMPNFGIAQSDPPTGAGNPYYVSVTTDGGLSWTATAPPGYPGTASAQNSIFVIDNMCYGWTSNSSPPACILTTDGGTTWNKRNTTVTGTFTSGCAFKDDKMTGIVASSTSLPNISRTTDAGVTWTTINTGAGPTGYCYMTWVSGTNTCYLTGDLGATGGIKKSTDGGLTWATQTTSGLTDITHMDYYRSGTNFYGIAVSTSAALKNTDMVTGVEPVNSSIPTDYRLEQNYPNPFNPTTTINFSIPSSSKVTLKVFNSLGKEVSTLVDEVKPAGNYSAKFTAASNLTSGIYFYTLTSDNFTETKKLMLVK